MLRYCFYCIKIYIIIHTSFLKNDIFNKDLKIFFRGDKVNYEQIKQKYKDYIVIQKQGIFYNVYGIDAYVISYIFD